MHDATPWAFWGTSSGIPLVALVLYTVQQMADMTKIPLNNPFSAPVFFLETTANTMLDARNLAAGGAPHGSVAAADFQEAGRGRGANRSWQAEKGKNLLFTVLLRYPGIASLPSALTLRTALALTHAIEHIAPALKGALRIKWPNDVMLPLSQAYRKTAGILAEWDGQCAFVGVGVNVHQTRFPDDIRNKAGSIALALGGGRLPPDVRCSLLEAFLGRLHADLEEPAGWRERLEERLYMKGENAGFAAGAADSGRVVEGRIFGLGEGGELLMRTADGIEAFAAGEVVFAANER
jgi:BirA family biotin operon repressor/biotin-[acetyl-CoA-carboxylase] ligase